MKERAVGCVRRGSWAGEKGWQVALHGRPPASLLKRRHSCRGLLSHAIPAETWRPRVHNSGIHISSEVKSERMSKERVERSEKVDRDRGLNNIAVRGRGKRPKRTNQLE